MINIDLVTEALHYIGKNHPEYKAVQIGAMDGINYDNTRGFFDMYKWNTILVEPIPEIFQELKENLKDRENLLYENSAISPKEGKLKMLTVPLSAIEENNLHPGYKGMSAAYPLKNGFGSDYQRDIDVKSKYGIDIEVDCITFDTLVSKHNFNDVNILVCDAEGYDWEIFKSIDLNKYNLQFIRLEYFNLTEEEKTQLKTKFDNAGYTYFIDGQDIDAVKKELFEKLVKTKQPEQVNEKDNVTLVTGLWDIQRNDRPFGEIYIPRFKSLLKVDIPMIIFLPKEFHSIVWEVRKPENTQVITLELEDLVQNYFGPHKDNFTGLFNSEKWRNITGEHGWLKLSPQASYINYNPVVMSKMFLLHDASIYNTFDTDYFYWIDAGLNMTVHEGILADKEVYKKIPNITDPFLFLSFPYKPAGEIHGFDQAEAERIAGSSIDYVCRGGFFGGHKEFLKTANSTYYSLLQKTLASGHMGTEESIFTIMSYLEPENYRRSKIGISGHILDFLNHVQNDTVEITEIPKKKSHLRQPVYDLNKYKTNLYILTFNFPKQLIHTINSMKKVPEWLEKPNLILIDNSTDPVAQQKNQEIAKEYNFEYIWLEGNKGICGGRQKAAEHFHESDSDFYFFFEDDMTSNPPEEEGKFCRNGLRKYIPNLYSILHKIILKEDFDYLKLSFTEVYWDNNIQTSWYNVPQAVRSEFWPEYDKLPITGIDPNAPRTKFNRIDSINEVAYINGDVTYTNWPMIMSRKGNQKVFIDTKWAAPFEQTWMSHVFQLQQKGEINAAVLLASPIWHDRILYYKPDERREN